MITQARAAYVVGTAAIASAGVSYVLEEHVINDRPDRPFTAWVAGRHDFGHDIAAATLITDASSYLSLSYCNTTILLESKKRGDTVYHPYADSWRCPYVDPDLPTIPIVGGDNADANRCPSKERMEDAIFISNGGNYGSCIDYYVTNEEGREVALSFTFAPMASIIMRINTARVEAGMSVLHTYQMKRVLDDSSDVDEVRDGRWYGQHIDVERAIEIATTPPDVSFLPAIYLLLLGDEDGTN